MRTNRLAALALVIAFLAAAPAYARGYYWNYAQRGNVSALTSVTGTSAKFQGSYPGASVLVKLCGTSTNATLYSTSAGAAQSNPVTASGTGYYAFWTDATCVSLTFSGGGIVGSFTIPFNYIPSAGSGGNVAGAVCDGVVDDTAAIQAAVDVTGGHTVTLPAGTCLITDQILIAQDSITIEGTGMKASTILYMPTVDSEGAFKAKKSTAAQILYPTFRNFAILTTDTTYVKYGIWLVDYSGATIEHVQIGTDGGWRGGANVSPFTGSGSIGIRLEGRDFGRFSDIHVAAAIPLYIGLNPNLASIDLDHTSFEDFYFLPYGDNPSVLIADGANLTSVVFNRGAFVKGGYGVYWNDTTSSSSFDVTFRGLRAEQFTSAGHMFYISSSGGDTIHGLRIEQSFGGTGTVMKGIYLRGLSADSGALIDGFKYYGTIECINADSTVPIIDWRNSFCQEASTKSLGTLVELWAEGLTFTTSPMPQSGRWILPNTTYDGGNVRRYLGVKHFAFTGSLADAATHAIPEGLGSLVTGIVNISFKGATVNGAISCAVNSARSINLATTDATLTNCTGNTAGDFTLDWVNVNNIIIRNNTGETVTFSYTYEWN